MPELRRAVILGSLIFVAACVARSPGPERIDLGPVDFDALPGWQEDRQSLALSAFRRSCVRVELRPENGLVGANGIGGVVADWRAACRAGADVPNADDEAARAFFEQYFALFRVIDRGSAEGLFTGYYEPLLSGARQRGGRYIVPIYGRPTDLVSVDLGDFRPGFKGRRIAGRIEGDALRPYANRAEIERGALNDRVPVIAWVDNPVDAFFLHVQGSGRISLENGDEIRVGYAAANGHEYRSIGGILVERGAMDRDAVTLPSIRAWLAAHPDESRALMDENESFIFFRELEGEGAIGAQGVALTPGRSIAVDRRFIPLGAPVWLDIMAPAAEPGAEDRSVRRLTIAQDTGAAITGPLRGDVFWGFGPEAEAIAGRMKHRGQLYLLLPLGVAERRASGTSP